MARVVGVFNTAHSPFLYMPPERWNEVRAGRALREDVPFDDLETNKRKKERIEAAFATMRQKMAALAPDVVIIFGDDQYECFEGSLSHRDVNFGRPPGNGERPEFPKAKLKGHPALGTSLLTGVMKRGFDPAFCMDMPKPDRGVGHAFLRPAESITDMKTPGIPALINCYS